MSNLFLTLLLVFVALLIPTAYAGKIGAPWAPTRKRIIDRVFQDLEISQDDVVVDLGAGDGKVLVAAGERGAAAYGYELSPIMWFVAAVRTMRNRRIHVLWQNFYRHDLPQEATVVFLFLLPENMPRVKQYLQKQSLPKVQFILSYAFSFPGVEPMGVIREKDCAPMYIYDPRSLES